MSIITNIFFGEIDMQDAFCNSEQYHQAMKDLIEADDKLRDALSEEQITLLNDAKEVNNRLTEIITAESFVSGFRLDAKLMLEVLLADE